MCIWPVPGGTTPYVRTGQPRTPTVFAFQRIILRAVCSLRSTLLLTASKSAHSLACTGPTRRQASPMSGRYLARACSTSLAKSEPWPSHGQVLAQLSVAPSADFQVHQVISASIQLRRWTDNYEKDPREEGAPSRR